MFKIFRGALLIAAICMLTVTILSANRQTANFEKDRLSFDYPQGWKLTDKTSEKSQYLMLTHEGSSALIIVIAQRQLICTPEQMDAARKEITDPYVKETMEKLEANNARVAREETKLMIGEETAEGIRLSTRLGDQPLTDDIFSLMTGHRFVNLIYIRTGKDSVPGDPAWEAVTRSLKVSAPTYAADDLPRPIEGGVLDGRALTMPKPDYPVIAKYMRAAGTVQVQITVDENGDVVEAKAVSGHPQLRAASEKAARQAKFNPSTLNCRPIKVTGLITYHFKLI